MIWNVNDQEFDSVLALPGERRYAYFVKRVADWGSIWGLGSEAGWVVAGDDEGHELFPIWPHPRFAAACATDAWAGNEPRSIAMSVWMERWIPGMERDGRMVAVFPTPSNKGVPVTADRLRSDLEEELSLIE